MKAISVMLVDDEEWVLDDLRTLIDWEAAGFSIVATAKNGKQALKKYRELLPQIVITDIQMPFMDGVELAKSLREMQPTPIILFLTSYSDFHYAKQAFQYDIDDYLLKNEISDSVLLHKLSILQAKIQRSHQIQNLLSREYITGLIKQSDPAAPIQPNLQPSQLRPAFFAFLEEDVPCPFLITAQSHQTRERMWQLSQFCLTQLSHADILLCCDIDASHLLIGIAPTTSLPQTAFRQFTEHITQLLAALRTHSGSSFTALAYPQPVSLHALCGCYPSIQQRFHFKYFLGTGCVYSLEDSRLSSTILQHPLELDRLYSALQAGDEQETKAYIRLQYDRVIQTRQYEHLLNISHLFYLILQNAMAQQLRSDAVLDIRPETAQHRWYRAEDICGWMVEKYSQLMQQLTLMQKKPLSSAVHHALSYIQERYADDTLKIDTIAEHVQLSSSRLSVLFKKEMGCTVNEYLTAFRIMKAQLLLRDGHYKVYEVASMVGYGSSQYFSQVFQQRVGVNPKDFYQWMCRYGQ